MNELVQKLHTLIDELPEDALYEAIESLERIKEFYADAPGYVPPPEPEIILIPARWGETITRPDYPFDPDEC